MVDLPPKGAISLHDAWNKFHKKLWNGHSAYMELSHYADLSNEVLYTEAAFRELPAEISRNLEDEHHNVINLEVQEIIKPFVSGRLEAMVWIPKKNTDVSITEYAWEEGRNLEFVFMRKAIDGGHGVLSDPDDPWTQSIGQSPFMERAQFNDWLSDYIIRSKQEDTPVRAAMREHLNNLVNVGLVSDERAEQLLDDWGLRNIEIGEQISITKGKPGRPEADYWKPARDALVKELRLRGLPSTEQPDWNSKALLDLYLRNHIIDHYDSDFSAADSTVRRHTDKAIKEFEAKSDN